MNLRLLLSRKKINPETTPPEEKKQIEQRLNEAERRIDSLRSERNSIHRGP